MALSNCADTPQCTHTYRLRVHGMSCEQAHSHESEIAAFEHARPAEPAEEGCCQNV